MKFCVITHVSHVQFQGKYYAYAPYVNEMNIWFRYVDEVHVVAPLTKETKLSPILSAYQANFIQFTAVSSFHLTHILGILKTFILLPYLLMVLFMACYKADHIHLRCPGNMGLLGCIVQIFFPNKPKTAKYAGNWDPNSKQPFTYRLQKWILNNTFLTRNMKVLVYGEWPKTSENILPFFTATYTNEKKEAIVPRRVDNQLRFMFVGTLTEGKRPLYALKLVNALKNKGLNVTLHFYGEGECHSILIDYINLHQLNKVVFLHGNQAKEVVEQAYKESHFLILASKSEGWPKVVAEAMFWACMPLTTNVSCVSYMIGNGTRGRLLQLNLEQDVKIITDLVEDESLYTSACIAARDWSQNYTTSTFETEISKLI